MLYNRYKPVVISGIAVGVVLHEGLHGLVGGHTELFVEFGRGAVALLGTLPEEAVVVAEERSVFHLALMLQDGVALEAQFFG